MQKRRITRFATLPLILLSAGIAVYFLVLTRGRPAPIPTKETLYEGVTYQRVVRYFPNAMIAHIIKIDTKAKGIQFLITPADSKSETPLNARTTSQFLDEFGLQIAINGDGFTPWWSRGPADYYIFILLRCSLLDNPVKTGLTCRQKKKKYSSYIMSNVKPIWKKMLAFFWAIV